MIKMKNEIAKPKVFPPVLLSLSLPINKENKNYRVVMVSFPQCYGTVNISKFFLGLFSTSLRPVCVCLTRMLTVRAPGTGKIKYFR
jgi:hypothetical protein